MIDKVLNSSANTFGTNEMRIIEEGTLKQPVIEQLENKANQKISKEELEKAVDGLDQFVQASRTHISFEFHEELKDYYVTVVDSETNEVIKELPAKKLLDTYASMLEFMGILVDKKI